MAPPTTPEPEVAPLVEPLLPQGHDDENILRATNVEAQHDSEQDEPVVVLDSRESIVVERGTKLSEGERERENERETDLRFVLPFLLRCTSLR